MLMCVFAAVLLVNERVFLPADAKRLRTAKMRGSKRGTGVFIVVDENGHAQIRSGVFFSQGSMDIGLGKDIEVVALPRMVDSNITDTLATREKILDTLPPLNNGKEWTDVAKDQYVEDTQTHLMDTITTHQDFISRRCYLEGINKPLYLVYHGKSVAVTPQVLASLGMPEVRKGELTVFKKAREKANIPLKTTDSELMFGTLLEPRVLKYFVPQNYTSSVQKGIIAEAEHRATLRARQGQNRILLPIMVIMIVLIVALVALKMVGLI